MLRFYTLIWATHLQLFRIRGVKGGLGSDSTITETKRAQYGTSSLCPPTTTKMSHRYYLLPQSKERFKRALLVYHHVTAMPVQWVIWDPAHPLQIRSQQGTRKSSESCTIMIQQKATISCSMSKPQIRLKK